MPPPCLPWSRAAGLSQTSTHLAAPTYSFHRTTQLVPGHSLQFHPMELYPAELDVQWEEIAGCFQREFVPKLQASRACCRRARSPGPRLPSSKTCCAMP